MMPRVAHLRQHRTTLTKIKDDFDNTFGNDVLFVKGSEALHLPDGVYYIFKMFCCWYVLVAVQLPGLL